MNFQKFTALTPELYQYSINIACTQSQAIQKIYEANSHHPQIHMQISNDEAQFLKFIIQSHGMNRVLEIGTFLGFSAAAMAEALPDDGKLITLDSDEKISELAHKNWQLASLDHKITLKLGKALDSLQTLVEQQQLFDLIFIDADKINYITYYEMAKKLLAPKGIIAVDNIFFHGEVCQEPRSKAAQAIHDFNKWVKKDKEMTICLLPIADGLMLLRKQEK
jgi:predicted O-methyltransferase YrrM